MRSTLLIATSLFIVCGISCKPPNRITQTQEEQPQEILKPIKVVDALLNKSTNEITLTFTEQTKYDPQLLSIMLNFFKDGPGGLEQIEEPPNTTWIKVAKGNMDKDSPKMLIAGHDNYRRLIVAMEYDSELVDTKTFDFKD